MSDLHLHILNLVAHRNQREVNDHDAVDHVADAASTARRQDLERTATRTRARVAAAQARRRYHRPNRPVMTVASRGELAGTMVSLRFSLDGSGASVPAEDTAR